MKRILSILLVLVAMPFAASAQWWLFPGSPQARKDTTVKQRPDSSVKAPVAAVPEMPAVQVADSLQAKDSLRVADEFVLDIPETINVTLLLPLKSTGKPSANFYEYYCGALMAVRDLGMAGLRVHLNVFDTEDKAAGVSDQVLAESDVIIGPVSPADLTSMAARCPDKYIISPMEPKAAGLADSLRIIQAPSSWKEQTDELIAWLCEEKGPHDNVLLMKDNSKDKHSEQTEYLLNALAKSGIDYSTINSTTFEEGTLKGMTRVLVASDRDVFSCSAINTIGNQGYRKGDVALYSTSKIRSLEGVNSSSPYNAEARLTASYYLDYESPEVIEFVKAYRAMFNCEPASFAFSGYDTMSYFVTMCAMYGRQWPKKLEENPGRGLQTDFLFRKEGRSGMVNSAVRRVRYYQDLSTSVIH